MTPTAALAQPGAEPVAEPRTGVALATEERAADAALASAAARTDAPREVATGSALPHVVIHCFADGDDTRDAFQRFAADRRAAHARVEVIEGGPEAAMRRYVASAPPDLVILASRAAPEALLWQLERLSEAAAGAFELIVVGRENDIGLYRALIARGVADYLLAPPDPQLLAAAAARLFVEPDAAPIGTVLATIGAKGGVGASILAQNAAWSLASRDASDVLLIDLDVAFGASAVNLDVEGPGAVGEALADASRLDAALLERLMRRRGERLCVLPASGALAPDGEEPSPEAVERLVEVSRRAVPTVVLDLPNRWTPQTAAALRLADRVAVVTVPTLPALRNAGLLFEALKRIRPNDPRPLLVLNQVGARPGEVARAEIAAAFEGVALREIPHDPRSFGAAEFDGEMLGEKRHGRRRRPDVDALADALAGRETGRRRRGWLGRLTGRR